MGGYGTARFAGGLCAGRTQNFFETVRLTRGPVEEGRQDSPLDPRGRGGKVDRTAYKIRVSDGDLSLLGGL